MTFPGPPSHPNGPFPPQQPPFPATGPGFPPVPPKPPSKKRMSTGGIVAIVIGSLVALCCIGGVVIAVAADPQPAKEPVAEEQAAAAGGTPAASGGTPAAKAATTPAKPAKTSDVAAAGSAVRDGKFEFKVVKGPECGRKQVGSEKAQGQFCLVTLQVKNTGNDARTFTSGNQSAFDAAGAKFAVDDVASLYANENGESFLEEINPGNQVTVTIVFDVAAGVKLTVLELHDSLFSGGVKVALA